jgi:hypothetical protein
MIIMSWPHQKDRYTTVAVKGNPQHYGSTRSWKVLEDSGVLEMGTGKMERVHRGNIMGRTGL